MNPTIQSFINDIMRCPNSQAKVKFSVKLTEAIQQLPEGSVRVVEAELTEVHMRKPNEITILLTT